MSKTPRQLRDKHQKAIAKLFDKLAYRHSRWTVWSDFVLMAACSLSLLDVDHREERARMGDEASKKYNAEEMSCFHKMFAEVVQALDDNPDQDFLGELFMALELNNEARGQFFTPYSVSSMMAELSSTDLKKRIEKEGWISVCDCAVGAGALLIAFANECRAQGVNYQKHILFVGQDIDYVAAMMCYIQLSLLGCPGYVIVGDTLSTPPTEPMTNLNVWYTPLYYMDIWQWRIFWKSIGTLQQPIDKKTEAATPPPLEEFQPTLF